MTKVCITYRMKRKNEVAETCITLPMTDPVAAMLLTSQGDSFQLVCGAPLNTLLRELSELQGYVYAGFCCAEEAELPKREEHTL